MHMSCIYFQKAVEDDGDEIIRWSDGLAFEYVLISEVTYLEICGSCDEAVIDIRRCHTNGVWASIVRSIFQLHSSGIVSLNFIRFKVGDGSSICFWKDTCRPVNVGRTKAEFDALISDIANLESEELVDFDTCIWSLSHDDKFSVNAVRKHIDELSLPSSSPSTGWYIDSIKCPVCNVSVESSAHTFFSCDTTYAIWHLVRVCNYQAKSKVNQKACIFEHKRRNHEEHYSDNLYAVSIKEDTAYPCPKLHSTSMKERSRRRLHTEEEMQTEGFKAYQKAGLRGVATKAELADYRTRISSRVDFLGSTHLYTLIREHLRRLCHWLIAFTISGRGQAPEKVTTTDLFFLRSMDEGTRLLDIVAWVAEGPQRHQVRAAGGDAEIHPEIPHDALVDQEDVQPDSAPQQAT
ncbi:hypothetical protein Tco_1379229 [Tanacetum coccineum]